MVEDDEEYIDDDDDDEAEESVDGDGEEGVDCRRCWYEGSIFMVVNFV